MILYSAIQPIHSTTDLTDQHGYRNYFEENNLLNGFTRGMKYHEFVFD